MSIMGIIILGIFIAILVKTGSLGKACGFLMKYLFFPCIFAIIGGIIAGFIGLSAIGVIVGAVVGFIFVFKDASKKIK